MSPEPHFSHHVASTHERPINDEDYLPDIGFDFSEQSSDGAEVPVL
jgi:hypothetical protein